MQRYRAIVPKLALVSLTIAVIVDVACRDTLTAPERVPAPASTISAPGDPGAPEIVFLAPLGPRHHPRGELDTTLTPSVTICKLEGDRCGTSIVARFSSDTAAPDSERVHVTEHAYETRWNVAAVTPDTGTAYRVTVLLADTTIGYTDFKIIPPNVEPPADDTARFALLTERKNVNIRFQIFVPPETLTVIVEPGVHGTLESGASNRRHGENVPYHFEADSGYTNVLVTLNQSYIQKHGRITMNGPRVLIASADRVASVVSGDEWILRDARAILHASDPVPAAQRLLTKLDQIDDTANLSVRLKQVENAILERESDAGALRALDAALVGHVFLAGDGEGTPDITEPEPGPAPGSGGGPPTATTLFAPRSAARVASSVQSGSAQLAGRGELLTIAHVNGVMTTPFGALFSANHIARLARVARWNANVPFNVRLIYNRSALMGDANDLTARCILELGERGDDLGLNSLPVHLAKCVNGTENQAMSMLSDFSEAGTELLSVLNHSLTVRPSDADTVAAVTTRWRDAGRHVVFVPHSQGNMIVQQGLELLRRQGRFQQSNDTTCIGVVSLAAPTSSGWPIASRHLDGLVVDGDAILALGQNHFPKVRTTLTDSAAQAMPHFPRSLIPGLVAAAKLRWGARLHGLVESYLSSEPIRTQVANAMVHTYRGCALGTVSVVPQLTALHTGDVATLHAELTDMNGDPLDGRRGLYWTADTQIDRQRAAQVSGDGSVRARYVGGTNVRAITRAVIGTGGVSVDPGHLVVTAKEHLSARWVLIPGMITPPTGNVSTPPTSFPDFPTSWGGGSCIAKTELHLRDQTGTFSEECTVAYDVVAAPFPSAARYQATFFETNGTAPIFSVSRSTGSIHGSLSAPAPTLDPLPGPTPMDRIAVTAWDAAGHLLASGRACIRGCAGWPPE